MRDKGNDLVALMKDFNISWTTLFKLKKQYKQEKVRFKDFREYLKTTLTPPLNYRELRQACVELGLPYSRIYYLVNTGKINKIKILNKIYVDMNDLKKLKR